MTVLVFGACATIVTAGAALPAAGAAATAGLTSAGVATTVTGSAAATAATVGGAAGAGAASGAIAGAVVGGTAATAATGAATGGMAAAGFTAASAGGAGIGSSLSAGALAMGPVGWCILGTERGQAEDECIFDCWKLVLHDETEEPSQGMLLRDVAMDPRMKDIVVTKLSADLPEISLTNTWDEEFIIEYLFLPSGKLALHAARRN